MNLSVLENYVVIIKKSKIIYKFPINEFNDNELSYITNNNFCPGCTEIPINGFNNRKKEWCDFSRKLAVLESKYGRLT